MPTELIPVQVAVRLPGDTEIETMARLAREQHDAHERRRAVAAEYHPSWGWRRGKLSEMPRGHPWRLAEAARYRANRRSQAEARRINSEYPGFQTPIPIVVVGHGESTGQWVRDAMREACREYVYDSWVVANGPLLLEAHAEVDASPVADLATLRRGDILIPSDNHNDAYRVTDFTEGERSYHKGRGFAVVQSVVSGVTESFGFRRIEKHREVKASTLSKFLALDASLRMTLLAHGFQPRDRTVAGQPS
jgi:hypothetical protein